MSLGSLFFRVPALAAARRVRFCPQCRDHLRQPPTWWRDPGRWRAVYALGPYSDIRRRIIIGMKERGNRPVREYVGAVFAAGLAHLRARGDIPREFTLIPAPTRPRSARARGAIRCPLCVIPRRSTSAWACARRLPWASPPRTSPSSMPRIGGPTCRAESRARAYCSGACAACRRRHYHRRHPCRQHRRPAGHGCRSLRGIGLCGCLDRVVPTLEVGSRQKFPAKVITSAIMRSVTER